MNTDLKTEEGSNRRPTVITVLCIYLFIGGILAIPLFISKFVQKIGMWYPPYLAFSTIVGLICVIGLWKMRKWSIFTYTALVVLNQIVFIACGYWNILTLVTPLIFISIGFFYLSKMK